MPPRRRAAAKPPADPPLDGCAIALSGKFDDIDHNHSSLETVIRKHGGTVTRSVTKATTHVVCTEYDFNAGTTKIAAAKAKDLPCVNPSWIVDTDDKGTKLNADDYTWSATPKTNGTKTATQAAPKAATNGTKSRKRASKTDDEEEEEEEEEEQPRAKRSRSVTADSKTTKATKATAAKATKATKAKTTKASKSKAAVKDESEEEEEEDFIKKKDVKIPLDEFCTLPTPTRPTTTISFIAFRSDPKGSTFKTWTRWGRVGEGGQKAVLGNGALADAIKQFEKKFKDKSGLSWENRGDNPKPGKYAFIERSYDPDSDDDEDEEDAKAVKKEGDEDETPAPECTLEKPVKELMELIFNQQYFQATMTSLNYDAKKLPLGKLSKATITRGFQQLKDLAALLDDPTLAASKWGMSMSQATEHLSNTFYTVIPHAFGRNRPPIIRDNSMLKKEIELLESLSDMKDAADIMKIDRKTVDTVHPLDRQFQGLGLEEMTPLDRKSNEFVHLENYLNESRGATHHMSYEVQDIFRIERQGETQRFDNSEYATIKSDRRLLWHGSRCTNFGGILSQGLRIAPPEAPVSGYMFGKGIYLADMSSKSAGYCCSYISNGHALLLLCEAELGDPLQKLTQADYDAGDNAKAKGMHSTWGQGNTGPSKWVDAGFVHESLKGIKMPDTKVKPGPTNVKNASLYYNEYICYDIAQVKLRYLLRVKI
ncbi:hypothetical protein LRP88_06444 [Fusarium phalaenopsidis]